MKSRRHPVRRRRETDPTQGTTGQLNHESSAAGRTLAGASDAAARHHCATPYGLRFAATGLLDPRALQARRTYTAQPGRDRTGHPIPLAPPSPFAPAAHAAAPPPLRALSSARLAGGGRGASNRAPPWLRAATSDGATGFALGAASLDRPGVVPGTQTFEKTTKRAAMTSNLNGALLASPILGVTSGGPPASHKAIGLKRSAPHPLAPERAR
jgi:hypothetical protein